MGARGCWSGHISGCHSCLSCLICGRFGWCQISSFTYGHFFEVLLDNLVGVSFSDFGEKAKVLLTFFQSRRSNKFCMTSSTNRSPRIPSNSSLIRATNHGIKVAVAMSTEKMIWVEEFDEPPIQVQGVVPLQPTNGSHWSGTFVKID